MARPEVTGKKLGSSKKKSDSNLPPPPRLAMSIPEFCEAHGLSEGMYYKMKKQGLGPRLMKCGSRSLVTFEAAADWRREREAAAAAAKSMPAVKTKHPALVTPPAKPRPALRRNTRRGEEATT
ncbi:hypothetical protein KIP88_14840 [Bradyrhizobium sp. SRL28]|uniref:hypothetical protein n=1 Tax=Bradyrhizobium sp. SRL28 TaxID=2836178 RepID=UPI001BDDDBAA|nr:hypothetical protein [Bradyrhizobium sp. SRL28]MBT1511786.1 hypothetical protein [Bradyrhizobium sp. SRL28]